MASDRLLETRTTYFGELFGNGRRYAVPAFQRDYAWNIENWEDLWQDILVSYRTRSPHFMGAIVTRSLEGEPITLNGEPLTVGDTTVTFRDRFLIIDGQQRLVTLSILVIAMIHHLQRLVDEGVDSDENTERKEILRRTYLGDRDPGSLLYSSKLFLNENNNGFYQTNLINLRRPKYLSGFTQSERLLWHAFEYFSEQIALQDNMAQSGAALAGLLTDTVAKRLVFIQVSVEDQSNAYALFETLNSRGMELSAVDLLKNYIFSLLLGPDDHYAGNQEWQRIVRAVGMEGFPDLLYCYLLMTDTQIKRQKLFKAVRRRIQNAEQAFDLLAQLSSYSNSYVALNNSNDDFWKAYPQSKQISAWIRQLNLFNLSQFNPVLLAASEKFRDDKLEKLLRMIVALSFRYIVSGLNLNELEKQCGKLAVAISSEQVKSLKAAFQMLSGLYPADDKFQQDFSLLSMSDQRKKGLLKYILAKLEKAVSGKDVVEDSFSIEHILPQNPGESWQQNFGAKKMSDWIYRSGNITLLEPDLNSALGRVNYAVKRDTISKSTYVITQQIQFESWTVNTVVHRQEQMSEMAVQIWRVDYDV